MLRAKLLALATLVVLATPVLQTEAGAAPADRAASGITGTWRGPVVNNQDGPTGYSGTVHLTRSKGKYRATVSYSIIDSKTKWVYDGRQGDWFRFREISRSSTDDGVGGVVIKAKRVGAYLAVRYIVPGSDIRGSMKAHRLR
jgi:hypothetical protein